MSTIRELYRAARASQWLTEVRLNVGEVHDGSIYAIVSV